MHLSQTNDYAQISGVLNELGQAYQASLGLPRGMAEFLRQSDQVVDVYGITEWLCLFLKFIASDLEHARIDGRVKSELFDNMPPHLSGIEWKDFTNERIANEQANF